MTPPSIRSTLRPEVKASCVLGACRSAAAARHVLLGCDVVPQIARKNFIFIFSLLLMCVFCGTDQLAVLGGFDRARLTPRGRRQRVLNHGPFSGRRSHLAPAGGRACFGNNNQTGACHGGPRRRRRERNTVLSGAEGRVAQRADAAAKTERQTVQKAAGGRGA